MAKETQALALMPAIAPHVEAVVDPAGRQVRVLKEAKALQIARQAGCPLPHVYRQALQNGIWPYRYIRNHGTFSLKDQERLATARIAVIGCGGLGGSVLHLLARIGIGYLTLIDDDRFDETNLNRQLVSRTTTLGQSKALAAQSLIAEINPGVHCEAHMRRMTAENARTILAGHQVVVDALDNIGDRLVMARACQKLEIPLVHGAIAGLEGQAMTIFPGDTGLKTLYGKPPSKPDPQRPEAVLGVPALMPSLVATLQAAEVVKIVLKRGKLFRNRLMHIDLDAAEFAYFSF